MMKLDGLIQSPIYNRHSVSVNSVFLLSSYINIPFMMIFLLLFFWGRNIFPMPFSWSSLVAHLVKNLPAMWETWVRCLGWEDSSGEGNSYPHQYSGLENSMDCIVHGVANSQTWLSEIHFHFSRFSGWSNNQIDIRQINKRTMYLITYLPPRTPQGQWYPRTSQAVETWMLFWPKEWDRVLGLERGRGCFTGQ